MAIQVTVYPGGPDTSELKGTRSKPAEDGSFTITCGDDQWPEVDKISGVPGIGLLLVADEPKKKPAKKKTKK